MTQAGRLHTSLARYEDVSKRVRAAASQYKFLSPMAQEDPSLRASAAQMLVKCFNAEGLSTPRQQVGPIPDHVSALEPSQASEQHASSPKSHAPPLNYLKPVVGNPKRINNASPKHLANGKIPRGGIHGRGVGEHERRGQPSGLRRFT